MRTSIRCCSVVRHICRSQFNEADSRFFFSIQHNRLLQQHTRLHGTKCLGAGAQVRRSVLATTEQRVLRRHVNFGHGKAMTSMRRQKGRIFELLGQSRAFSFSFPTQRFLRKSIGGRTPSFASGIGAGRSWFGRPRTLSEIMSDQMAITGRERGRHSCGSSFSPPLSRYVKPGRKVLRSEDTTAGLTIMLIQIPPSVTSDLTAGRLGRLFSM